jgi:hypothetical protein
MIINHGKTIYYEDRKNFLLFLWPIIAIGIGDSGFGERCVTITLSILFFDLTIEFDIHYKTKEA